MLSPPYLCASQVQRGQRLCGSSPNLFRHLLLFGRRRRVVDVENSVYYDVDASLHVLSGVAGELSYRHVCDVFEFSLGDVV